jgi:hypothetical protein
LLKIILWLFFLNALLNRLSSYYFGWMGFTRLYYGVLTLALGLRVLTLIGRTGGNRLALSGFAFLVSVAVLGAAYGDVTASAYGIEQFFIGVVFLVLYAGRWFPVETVLQGLLMVQSYAVVQGLWFVSAQSLPPWDLVYVQQLMESYAARNLYQGDLIRPFATFASFSEYQIVVHMLVTGLVILRDRLAASNRRLLWLLVASVLTIDVLLPDRTPIFMAAIFLTTTALGLTVVHGALVGSGRFVLGVALVMAVAASLVVIPPVLGDSEVFAVRRLAEGVRFWEAETVQERAATVWDEARRVIREHPEGVGPAAVATGYNPDALTPHNNYFLFAMGYSIAFPFVFFTWLGLTFRRLYATVVDREASTARLGFAAFGLTLAYMASAGFNAPFSSYMGVAFMLLLQWFHGEVSHGVGEPEAV